MTDFKTTVGNVEMVSLTDGQGAGPPTGVFPESTDEIWRAEYPELVDAEGMIHPRYGCLAVRSSGKLIIVDTGMQAPDGALLNDMKAKGVDRDAVDLVVTTHLHPDHVGWNLTDGKPTFPKARYLAPRTDWDYWTQPSVVENAAHIQNQVLPLNELNLLDLMDDDYQITDELQTLATPGHTPGHISIRVTSAGERGFILGDVAHSPAQAHYTDWNPAFDMDGATARQTRNRIVDKLEEEGAVVATGHFPDPGFGRFVRQAGRRVWQVL
ncbi:MAG: MBL fold metallo-hydrolase [SAR202 cluster bacterium]|nr:MBL fold metallo-hydrolase [SAR202 cluster bacterium]|tara:strand:- start:1681 stop:2484 length:804 start_codon:yes stop_codon:yes gene_type:complete